jgi:hypothetical protein
MESASFSNTKPKSKNERERNDDENDNHLPSPSRKKQNAETTTNESKQEEMDTDFIEKDVDLYEVLDVETVNEITKQNTTLIYEISTVNINFQQTLDYFQQQKWIDRTQCTQRDSKGLVYFLSEETAKAAAEYLKGQMDNPPLLFFRMLQLLWELLWSTKSWIYGGILVLQTF